MNLHSRGFQPTPVGSGGHADRNVGHRAKNCLRKCETRPRDRKLVVGMKNVTTISQEGENVLIELMNEGVKFPGGVFTKHLLRQIARNIPPNRPQTSQEGLVPICVNHKREGHHE
jgi:hypothetical protein